MFHMATRRPVTSRGWKSTWSSLGKWADRTLPHELQEHGSDTWQLQLISAGTVLDTR